MTIRIGGLGASGLDVDALVSQMVNAKRVSIDKMFQKKTYLEWQRDSYRDMNTDMSSFMKEVQKLTLQSSILTKKASVSSADTDKVSITPSANALNGNFSLEVKQIAKSATIVSSDKLGISTSTSQAFASDNATLQITGSVNSPTNSPPNNVPVAVSISSGDNINQIISKINAVTSKTGVKASYDQLSDKLTLINTSTGAAGNVLQIEDTNGTDLLSKLKLTAPNIYKTSAVTNGQDAKVNFNGTGEVTVSTNIFKMNDINFTLLKDPGTTPYTVNGSVNLDVDAVIGTIKGVFNKYNELIEKAHGKLNETKYRDYLPLTDAQKQDMKESDVELWEKKAKSGLLRGDSVLKSGLDKMRQYLSSNVSGLSDQYNSLADIGITTAPSSGSNTYSYLENGKIYIDEDKLRQALTTSPDEVVNIFTKDGARNSDGKLTGWSDAGIGSRLYEIVKNDIVSGLTQKTQLVPTKSTMLLQIDDYASRIDRAEDALTDYEQQLYSRFASMESALTKLSNQGASLSSFFQSK